MASISEIEAALIKADSLGNVEDARALARHIRYLREAMTPPEPPPNPAEGMTNSQLAAAGAGKAITDLGRGAGQLVGLVSRKDVQAARNRDEPLTHTLPGLLGDFGGNVAMALAPGAALKGAGMLSGSRGLMASGDALMVPRGAGQVVGVGGGMGLLQPSASSGETARNMALGVAGSAFAPLLARGKDVVITSAEPFHREGQNRILGRLLQKTAGGEAPEVAGRLRGAFEPFVGASPEGQIPRQFMGEIVPGSVPTLAQAAQNPGIGALEKTVAQTDPAQSLIISKRLADQNAARVKVLEDMAGTDGMREFYDAARKSTAEDLYKEAYAKGVDLRRNAVTGEFLSKAQQAARKGEITKLMSTPAMQDAAEKARNLMANDPNLKGKLMDPAGSVQGLDYTRRALSDMISNAQGNEQRILIGLRDRLDTTLDSISPAYGEARRQFQSMSRPINQMDVAKTIADKSVSPLTGQMRPETLARALSDDTARAATGFKGATMEGMMEPGQLRALQAIKEDLARAKAAENIGRGPGSDTVQKLAYSNMIDAAGLPNWVRSSKTGQIAGNLAGRGADALYGRANKEMTQRLAEVLANPVEAANILAIASEKNPEKLAKALRQVGATTGLALPGTVNIQQE